MKLTIKVVGQNRNKVINKSVADACGYVINYYDNYVTKKDCVDALYELDKKLSLVNGRVHYKAVLVITDELKRGMNKMKLCDSLIELGKVYQTA